MVRKINIKLKIVALSEKVKYTILMKILGVNISHHPSICIYENKTITEFYNEETQSNSKLSLIISSI